MIHVLETVAALLLLALCAIVALVRYALRPRRARLEAASTGLPVETVSIPSRSGATLAGWFLAGSGEGGVLLLHGVKSNRLTHVERMRMLREAGYSSLAIDFQAHGQSTGSCITLGQKEALDARSALEWMRARLPGHRLAVLGVSMGGVAALVAEPPLKADALIVESAFRDLATSVSNRLANALGEASRAATPLALLALRAAAGVDPRRLRPIDAIGQIHAPIFILSGADDRNIPNEEARALFARANPPKIYWEEPGAGHIDLAYVGGAAYRKRLLDFLESALRAEKTSSV